MLPVHLSRTVSAPAKSSESVGGAQTHASTGAGANTDSGGGGDSIIIQEIPASPTGISSDASAHTGASGASGGAGDSILIREITASEASPAIAIASTATATYSVVTPPVSMAAIVVVESPSAAASPAPVPVPAVGSAAPVWGRITDQKSGGSAGSGASTTAGAASAGAGAGAPAALAILSTEAAAVTLSALVVGTTPPHSNSHSPLPNRSAAASPLPLPQSQTPPVPSAAAAAASNGLHMTIPSVKSLIQTFAVDPTTGATAGGTASGAASTASSPPVVPRDLVFARPHVKDTINALLTPPAAATAGASAGAAGNSASGGSGNSSANPTPRAVSVPPDLPPSSVPRVASVVMQLTNPTAAAAAAAAATTTAGPTAPAPPPPSGIAASEAAFIAHESSVSIQSITASLMHQPPLPSQLRAPPPQPISLPMLMPTVHEPPSPAMARRPLHPILKLSPRSSNISAPLSNGRNSSIRVLSPAPPTPTATSTATPPASVLVTPPAGNTLSLPPGSRPVAVGSSDSGSAYTFSVPPASPDSLAPLPSAGSFSGSVAGATYAPPPGSIAIGRKQRHSFSHSSGSGAGGGGSGSNSPQPTNLLPVNYTPHTGSNAGPQPSVPLPVSILKSAVTTPRTSAAIAAAPIINSYTSPSSTSTSFGAVQSSTPAAMTRPALLHSVSVPGGAPQFSVHHPPRRKLSIQTTLAAVGSSAAVNTGPNSAGGGRRAASAAPLPISTPLSRIESQTIGAALAAGKAPAPNATAAAAVAGLGSGSTLLVYGAAPSGGGSTTTTGVAAIEPTSPSFLFHPISSRRHTIHVGVQQIHAQMQNRQTTHGMVAVGVVVPPPNGTTTAAAAATASAAPRVQSLADYQAALLQKSATASKSPPHGHAHAHAHTPHQKRGYFKLNKNPNSSAAANGAPNRASFMGTASPQLASMISAANAAQAAAATSGAGGSPAAGRRISLSASDQRKRFSTMQPAQPKFKSRRDSDEESGSESDGDGDDGSDAKTESSSSSVSGGAKKSAKQEAEAAYEAQVALLLAVAIPSKLPAPTEIKPRIKTVLESFTDEMEKRKRVVYSCADDSDILIQQRRKMQSKTWKYKERERAGLRLGSKSRVMFRSQVREREYARAQAGSSSVPKSGGHSLGLDWKITGENIINMRDGESKKYPSASKESELQRLEEKERKFVLLLHSAEVSKEEGEALTKIRDSRNSQFCTCKGNEPGKSCAENSDCVCHIDGVRCHVEGPKTCQCSRNGCGNPLGRFVYDGSALHYKRHTTLRTEVDDKRTLLEDIESFPNYGILNKLDPDQKVFRVVPHPPSPDRGTAPVAAPAIPPATAAGFALATATATATATAAAVASAGSHLEVKTPPAVAASNGSAVDTTGLANVLSSRVVPTSLPTLAEGASPPTSTSKALRATNADGGGVSGDASKMGPVSFGARSTSTPSQSSSAATAATAAASRMITISSSFHEPSSPAISGFGLPAHTQPNTPTTPFLIGRLQHSEDAEPVMRGGGGGAGGAAAASLALKEPLSGRMIDRKSKPAASGGASMFEPDSDDDLSPAAPAAVTAAGAVPRSSPPLHPQSSTGSLRAKAAPPRAASLNTLDSSALAGSTAATAAASGGPSKSPVPLSVPSQQSGSSQLARLLGNFDGSV